LSIREEEILRRFEGREEEEAEDEEGEESNCVSEVDEVPSRLSESVRTFCQLEGREN